MMDVATTLTLLLPEIVLLVGALLVLALDLFLRDERQQRYLPYAALLVPLAGLVSLLPLWGREESLLGAMLAVDTFAVFYQAVVLLCTALVILGSASYIRQRNLRQGEFYVLMLFAALAMCLAVAANDLIMLYLAFETLSLTCYVLVAYLRGDRFSSEAGLKYFLYGAVASALMLYGISLLYGAAGTTNLVQIAEQLRLVGASLRWLALPVTVLLLAGFSFKIVIAPFHQWAPDAYEGAPTPVTAFLAVGSKLTGFAVLMRVMVVALGDFQPTWARLLGAFAIVSMIIGNFVALQQTNIKRMLAYSSIAHAGYIMIGFVTYVLSPQPFTGLNGVLLYAAVYLFTNIGIFMAVIAVEEKAGTQISDYVGLSRRSPWLAVLMAYLLFSLTGIPFTGGMFAKFFVFAPAIQAGPFGLLLAGIGIATSVVSAFYYLNVVRVMFFQPPANPEAIKPGRNLQVAILITAIVTLAIGLYPQPLINLASRSVVMLGMLLQ